MTRVLFEREYPYLVQVGVVSFVDSGSMIRPEWDEVVSWYTVYYASSYQQAEKKFDEVAGEAPMARIVYDDHVGALVRDTPGNHDS